MINPSDASNPTVEAPLTDLITSPITVDEAEKAYLKRATDARAKVAELSKNSPPDKKQKTETPPQGGDEGAEAPVTQNDDEPEKPTGDGGDDEGDAEDAIADDEAKVRIKVGDDEHLVSVKDMKRLYGQEAALTKKSQEIATQRKEYEERTTKSVRALETMTQRAQAAYEPYSKIDWAQAARQLDPNAYEQLRADASEAHNNIKYLNEELDGQMKGAQEYVQNELKRQASVAAKQLSDITSPHYIEGWGKETYSKMRDFATSSGIPAETFDTVVDPAALKIINDAMLFRAQKAKATEVITKAKAKVVSDKQMKPKQSQPSEVRDKAAMARLQESGSVDDAAAVWLARQNARRAAAER